MSATLSTLDDVLRQERTPWQTLIPARTTYGLLRQACERFGARTALRLLADGSADAPTRDQSYAELLDSVHRTANALHALGVAARTPVAILLPNVLETHWALWGAQACGIAAPLNPMLDAAYLGRVCDETGAAVLIAPAESLQPEVWRKAAHVANAHAGFHTLMVVGAKDAADIARMRAQLDRSGLALVDFQAALDAAPGERLTFARDIAPQDPCAYFLTGGTTASPKVAVHTHGNEAFMAWALEFLLGERQVFLSGLPLFHVNGALVTGLGAFHSGSEVVLLTAGGFRTPGLLDNFWSLANRFGATLFSAVPTIYAALAHKPLPPGGLRSLRRGICGAAPLPPQVRVDFEQAIGVRMHEGYGMTEGSCVSSFNPLQAPPRAGSVGIRLPYQDLRVFRAQAAGAQPVEAAVGEVGVVGIRGPNVFPGYLRQSDNARLWLAEGWLNTGDLGRLDAEGNLSLCGRAKDLIIRGGHNIDPLLIEDALSAHPGVAMAAAIGQPDLHAGEVPVAYVCPKPGVQLAVHELAQFAARNIQERAAVPARIEVLPALPLTAVGKISKPHLRLLAHQHAARAALAEAGLAVPHLDGVIDVERGPVVRVDAEAEAIPQLRALLGRFNMTCDIKELHHG